MSLVLRYQSQLSASNYNLHLRIIKQARLPTILCLIFVPVKNIGLYLILNIVNIEYIVSVPLLMSLVLVRQVGLRPMG